MIVRANYYCETSNVVDVEVPDGATVDEIVRICERAEPGYMGAAHANGGWEPSGDIFLGRVTVDLTNVVLYDAFDKSA